MPAPIGYVPALGHVEAYNTDHRTGLAASTTDLGGGNTAGGKVGLDVNLIGSNGTPFNGGGVVDPNNTTSTPLAANGTFTGTATNITPYSQLTVDVYGRPGVVAGDGSSAKGSFYFEFSPDGTNWDTSVPQLVRDPSLVIPVPIIFVNKYFRVRYLNDGGAAAIAALGLTDVAGTPTNQTTFRLTTYLQVTSTKELTRTMDQGISGSDPAVLVRAGITGLKPSGTFANASVTEDLRLAVSPSGDFSIFGTQVTEVANDYISCVFTSDGEMNAQTYDASANGGSTATSSGNLVIQSGTATNGDGNRISKSKIIYNPGHEGRGKFTAVFDAATAGCKQQIGIISKSGNNGIYLEKDGTSISLVHLRNGSVVRQDYLANWNGTLGTQFTKAGTVVPYTDTVGRAYQIAFGYLGYLGYNLHIWSPDKHAILAHTVYYDNETVPLFTETELSIFSRVVKTSGASNVTLKTASWEGASLGNQKTPLISAANRTVTPLTAGSTFTGDWISTEGYSGIEIIVATDRASQTNGIVIQFSERGDAGAVVRTTSTDTFDNNDVTVGSKKIITTPYLSYVRLVYTNGGIDQSTMFMELRLHANALENRRSSIESTLTASNTAVMTRGLTVALNDSGTYGNITRSSGTTDANSKPGMRVSISEDEVGLNIRGLTSAQAGSSTNLGTVTPTQIANPALTNRKSITIIADPSNNKVITIGFSNSAGACVFPLAAGAAWFGDVDATVNIYAFATAANNNIQWIEVAGSP